MCLTFNRNETLTKCTQYDDCRCIKPTQSFDRARLNKQRSTFSSFLLCRWLQTSQDFVQRFIRRQFLSYLISYRIFAWFHYFFVADVVVVNVGRSIFPLPIFPNEKLLTIYKLVIYADVLQFQHVFRWQFGFDPHTHTHTHLPTHTKSYSFCSASSIPFRSHLLLFCYHIRSFSLSSV